MQREREESAITIPSWNPYKNMRRRREEVQGIRSKLLLDIHNYTAHYLNLKHTKENLISRNINKQLTKSEMRVI